jgi:hypothetical protein
MTKKRAALHAKWSYGNPVKSDKEIRFIDMKEMPMELMQLSTPVQYFKYFMTRDILEYMLHKLYYTLFNVAPQKCLVVL